MPQPPRPDGDPAPLPYLADATDQQEGALAIELEALITTPAMKRQGLAPHSLSVGHATDLYWTPAQMVTQQASNGCNLRPGDLLGTGTISAPDGTGSLLEITSGGRQPITLPSGEVRRFLEDGDEICLRAPRCPRWRCLDRLRGVLRRYPSGALRAIVTRAAPRQSIAALPAALDRRARKRPAMTEV